MSPIELQDFVGWGWEREEEGEETSAYSFNQKGPPWLIYLPVISLEEDCVA